MKKTAGLIIALLVLVSSFSSAVAQGETGLVRFVHAIPGVAAVDIYVNGELTISKLDYGEASGYINVPVGGVQLTVRPGGVSTTLWTQQITAGAETPQILIAASLDPLEFTVFEDDLTANAVGTTRFKAIHAISGGPSVDLLVGPDAVAQDWQYGQVVGTFDIPADVYNLSVIPTGGSSDTALLPETPVSLDSSTSEIMVLYGTASIPEVLELSAPLSGGDDAGFVRIAHAVADAPAVDVFANDTMIAPALAFGETTEHLALPAGDYAVELRVRDDGSVVVSADVTVESGTAATAVALGTAAEEVTIDVFADEIGSVDASQAVVTVINAIPDSASVSAALADGTSLGEGIAFGESGSAVTVDPSDQVINFTLAIAGQEASLQIPGQDLYGGVYYNAIAIDGTAFQPPTLLIAGTSLAQGVGSAPGAGTMAVVEVVEPTQVPEPTAAEVVETEEPTAVVEVVATPEETEVAATPVPTVLPPAVSTEEAPATARIALDPGVNLQLRQFPSADALSLGLAPSGSTVIVNGREGAPVDLDGNEIQVQDANGNLVDFVDPVTLLDPADEKADLDPSSTWINITYQTPDGGQITAWTVALYLDITNNQRNEEQVLKELNPVPRNRAGEAVNTDVTPPPVQKDRVTVVVTGLDQGVNLNIRRTPEAGGEVLARVPNGTIMEYVGLITETEDWVFVQLATADGATVTGWISTGYVAYQLNGASTDLEELQIRGLKATTEPTTRGAVGAGAPALAQPTVNPLIDAFISTVQLDPGASLNLRRTPTVEAEVVARIPTGTTIVLTGRTENSEWVQTSFEGLSGWVSSDYVFNVTFNGDAADILSLPIINLSTDDATEEAPAGS